MDRSTKKMPELTPEELEDLEWQQIEREILDLHSDEESMALPEDPWKVNAKETTKFRYSRLNGHTGDFSDTMRLRPAQDAVRAHRAAAAGENDMHSIDESGKTSGKKTKNAKKTQKEASGVRSALSFLAELAVVIAFAWLIVTFVGQRTVVDGTSMWPTLNHADSLWIDKLSYRFRDPKRFEIVVFPYEYEENTYYIKRIIGLPGENVRIDEAGNIYINGELLEEDFGAEPIYVAGLAGGEGITLGADEYFVMGDNRNNSKDSRFDTVGPVQRSHLLGHVIWRLWPLSAFGAVD